MDIIHEFWYIANDETPDCLYLMSHKSILDLMSKYEFISANYTTYNGNNLQRIYHELFSKHNIVPLNE